MNTVNDAVLKPSTNVTTLADHEAGLQVCCEVRCLETNPLGTCCANEERRRVRDRRRSPICAQGILPVEEELRQVKDENSLLQHQLEDSEFKRKELTLKLDKLLASIPPNLNLAGNDDANSVVCRLTAEANHARHALTGVVERLVGLDQKIDEGHPVVVSHTNDDGMYIQEALHIARSTLDDL